MGESKASYTILRASEFTNWTAAITNDALDSARTISVAVSNQAGFFEVETRPLPVFRFALACTGKIEMKGNYIATDSFNSSPSSTNNTSGKYDPAKAMLHGDIGTG